MNELQHVRFLFDPACPWAYRASLWVREVAEVMPLTIEWELFSLEYINREQAKPEMLNKLRKNRQALRLLAHASQLEGQAGIDALYLELGKAIHEHQGRLADEASLARALSTVGLPVTLLAETRTDPDLDARLETSYARAMESKAFGVPTLYVNGNTTPFYGPLIETVPSGYEAARLWEYVAGLTALPYFYELKRTR